MRGIHCWPVNSLHKGPVMQKMFPFDDVIMWTLWNKLMWNYNQTMQTFCEGKAILIKMSSVKYHPFGSGLNRPIAQIQQCTSTHNSPASYSTRHQFVTEMCTYVHISATKWYIVGYLSDALWVCWDVSICHWPMCIYPPVPCRCYGRAPCGHITCNLSHPRLPGDHCWPQWWRDIW